MLDLPSRGVHPGFLSPPAMHAPRRTCLAHGFAVR
jgi:hypothetical protein